MKPLELMKQDGQIPRPKPPVEQRVKVMDTLDKKMQTILEREDLSADERLKLYDQSFTRYLNVYDDYRLKPVAVAPEPRDQSNLVEHLLLVRLLRIFPSLWVEIFPFVQHVVD
jgi:hypothetical protein